MSRDRAGLRKSGSNEVEIVEFLLGKQSFGVNVTKVREFVPFDMDSVTTLPNAPPSLQGIFVLRGRTIPLIDLNSFLGLPPDESVTQRVAIVTEFNQRTDGFIVDRINKIHRLSWDQFQPLNNFFSEYGTQMLGSISVEGREVFVLDLEHIIGEVSPEAMAAYREEEPTDQELAQRRSQTKVIMAEDSGVIREHLAKKLKSVGYANLTVFSNGVEALAEVQKLSDRAAREKQPLSQYLTGVISDIEMPAMDGLTLCQKIRQEVGQSELPFILFSSLINEHMGHKCRAFGATSWTKKPDMADLIDLMDRHLLPEED